MVHLPIEFLPEDLPDEFNLTDEAGNILYTTHPTQIKPHRKNSSTLIAEFSVPTDVAAKIVGFQIQIKPESSADLPEIISNDTIVCRCERVTAGEIRKLIAQGITDINQIKAITRAGMGACGSNTCHLLIQRLLRDAGFKQNEIIENTFRPLQFEVEMETLANLRNTEEK
jgi:sarcosine oxidase subunit alpha